MEYLRAILTDQTRGQLYKKDFEVQKVFRRFFLRHLRKLIALGEIGERGYYSAMILPRFGTYYPEKRKEEGIGLERKRRHGRLSLRISEPVSSAPLDFFTLELYVEEERPYVLRENFLLQEIDYFWEHSEQVLLRLGILRAREHPRRLLFARNDDLFDFDREEFATLQQAADALIEIIGEDGETFAARNLATFPLIKAQKTQDGRLVDVSQEKARPPGDGSSGALNILLTRPALEHLQEHVCGEVGAEIGGYLVGNVYQDEEEPGYLVEITNHIPAQSTLASEVELQTTFESWQQQTLLLKERYPDRRIVGWYHTHLDLVSRTRYNLARNTVYISPLFFSLDDEFTHRHFFREKWYVAMVLDTRGNFIFYTWEGHTIVPAAKFFLIEAEPDQDT